MKTDTLASLDSFTAAYVSCALWSSHDNADENGGEPMDSNYDVSDIAPETLQRMAEDCAQFMTDNVADLATCGISTDRQGHDFWLNRNGHGSGFWDEYYGPVAEVRAAFVRLSDASKAWGSFDLYIGDDGQIYGS